MRIINELALLLFLIIPVCVQARPHWYGSRHFWAAFAIAQSAAAFDFETSQQAFARGARETNPIFMSRNPSFARMVAIDSPFTFGESYSAYRLSESTHRWLRDAWLAPITYDSAQHIYLGFHNEGVCRLECK